MLHNSILKLCEEIGIFELELRDFKILYKLKTRRKTNYQYISVYVKNNPVLL